MRKGILSASLLILCGWLSLTSIGGQVILLAHAQQESTLVASDKWLAFRLSDEIEHWCINVDITGDFDEGISSRLERHVKDRLSDFGKAVDIGENCAEGIALGIVIVGRSKQHEYAVVGQSSGATGVTGSVHSFESALFKMSWDLAGHNVKYSDRLSFDYTAPYRIGSPANAPQLGRNFRTVQFEIDRLVSEWVLSVRGAVALLRENSIEWSSLGCSEHEPCSPRFPEHVFLPLERGGVNVVEELLGSNFERVFSKYPLYGQRPSGSLPAGLPFFEHIALPTMDNERLDEFAKLALTEHISDQRRHRLVSLILRAERNTDGSYRRSRMILSTPLISGSNTGESVFCGEQTPISFRPKTREAIDEIRELFLESNTDCVWTATSGRDRSYGLSVLGGLTKGADPIAIAEMVRNITTLPNKRRELARFLVMVEEDNARSGRYILSTQLMADTDDQTASAIARTICEIDFRAKLAIQKHQAKIASSAGGGAFTYDDCSRSLMQMRASGGIGIQL